MIGEHTSAELQAAKAWDKRLGVGNRQMDPSVLQRIVELREEGSSMTAIADRLNDEGVPTTRGGRCWYPSTVRSALESHRLDVEADSGGRVGMTRWSGTCC
jgi:hypothetical protein